MIAPKTDNTQLPVEEVQQSFGGGQRDGDHPSLLNPNEYSKGVNADIRKGGSAQTRDCWQSKTTVSPGGSFQGEGSFVTAAGVEYIIQVNSGKFWSWDGSSTSWTRVGTVQLNNVSLPVTMVELNNRIYVACGISDNGYSWNGTDAEFLDEGNTNTDMPRGSLIWMQADRLCVAGVALTAAITNAYNYVFFSDINDGSTFDRTVNCRRVPTKNNEPITGGAAYRNSEILVFTRNTTHDFDITGTTIANFTRITIDTIVGCVAHKTIVVIGEDAYFLSADRHVRTIKRTVQDIALGVSVPITFLNDKVMGRIHEANVNLCAATFFNNYYLLAAPLDGDADEGDTSVNTMNSHVIAFDNLLQRQGASGSIPACAGEWSNIAAGGWVITHFSGRTKLHFIDSVTGNAKNMFGYESDDGSYPVMTIRTRACSWGAPNYDKTIHSAEIQVLETFGTMEISYAKDNGVFTAFKSETISDGGSRLPIALPFVLTEGGILALIFLRLHRKGRSRYWQLKLSHSDGRVEIKQFTLRAFVEQITTRSLIAA